MKHQHFYSVFVLYNYTLSYCVMKTDNTCAWLIKRWLANLLLSHFKLNSQHVQRTCYSVSKPHKWTGNCLLLPFVGWNLLSLLVLQNHPARTRLLATRKLSFQVSAYAWWKKPEGCEGLCEWCLRENKWIWTNWWGILGPAPSWQDGVLETWRLRQNGVKERWQRFVLHSWSGHPRGVNFTNLLWTAFLNVIALQNLSLITSWLCNFLARGNWRKSCL